MEVNRRATDQYADRCVGTNAEQEAKKRLPVIERRENSSKAPGKSSEIKGSSFIGEYLFELWKNQCLCDVKLKVGGCTYFAHKIVLAAFSDVFCPGSTNITPSVCVDIPGTTPEALYQVLQYLYTSEMELTDESLEPIICAASFMGITDIVDMVKEILANPTLENLEFYAGIRKRLGIPNSIKDFQDLVRENFLELTNTEIFLSISCSELAQLLEDPAVMVDSEMDTLEAVIRWLEYNPLERMGSAGLLLSKISLDCIDPKALAEMVENKRHVLEDPRAQEVLMEAFKRLATTRPVEQSTQTGAVKKPRKAEFPLVVKQYDSQKSQPFSPPSRTNFWQSPCSRSGPTVTVPGLKNVVRACGQRNKTFTELKKNFAEKRRLDVVGCEGKQTDVSPKPTQDVPPSYNRLVNSRVDTNCGLRNNSNYVSSYSKPDKSQVPKVEKAYCSKAYSRRSPESYKGDYFSKQFTALAAWERNTSEDCWCEDIALRLNERKDGTARNQKQDSTQCMSYGMATSRANCDPSSSVQSRANGDPSSSVQYRSNGDACSSFQTRANLDPCSSVQSRTNCDPCSSVQSRTNFDPCSSVQSRTNFDPCSSVQSRTNCDPCSSVQSRTNFDPCSSAQYTKPKYTLYSSSAQTGSANYTMPSYTGGGGGGGLGGGGGGGNLDKSSCTNASPRCRKVSFSSEKKKIC